MSSIPDTIPLLPVTDHSTVPTEGGAHDLEGGVEEGVHDIHTGVEGRSFQSDGTHPSGASRTVGCRLNGCTLATLAFAGVGVYMIAAGLKSLADNGWYEESQIKHCEDYKRCDAWCQEMHDVLPHRTKYFDSMCASWIRSEAEPKCTEPDTITSAYVRQLMSYGNVTLTDLTEQSGKRMVTSPERASSIMDLD